MLLGVEDDDSDEKEADAEGNLIAELFDEVEYLRGMVGIFTYELGLPIDAPFCSYTKRR